MMMTNQTNQRNQILSWLKEVQIKNNKGQPVEFDDHYFLYELLRDDAKRIVVKKCTQVGVSFTISLKILFLGSQGPLSIIYTLPTATEAKEFVLSKFEPIIERSPGLRSQVQKIDLKGTTLYSTSIKKIGESFYFFRGSWASWKAQSIDADVLVIDELDFQKPEVMKMFEERVEGRGSKDIIYWVGVPSFPGYGIDDLYDKSDQREWHIKCPDCKRQQVLDWPDNINPKLGIYICKYCKKELPESARKLGQWIPKYPGRIIHGYYINRLIAPWIPASRIVKAFKNDKPKHFNNFTMGRAYQEKTTEIDDSMFTSGRMPVNLLEGMEGKRVVVGIDQGDQYNLISGWATPSDPIVNSCEILNTPDEIEERCRVLDPELIVIDMAPDKHLPLRLMDVFGKDRVLMADLRSWKLSEQTKACYKINRVKSSIDMERTLTLDRMFDLLRNAGIKWTASATLLDIVKLHLKSLVPDYVERAGTLRKIWKKVGKKDDFAHALNFFIVACDIVYPENPVMMVTEIVDNLRSDDSLEIGSPTWLRKDFEKSINKLANPDGIIVIPPIGYRPPKA